MLAGALAVALALPAAVQARPAYFDQFKLQYGVNPGDNLDACGVCHFRWSGTGSRNPYGTTVEQQLYIGKTISQSLTDVEGMDPDGDGYTSGDEILNYMTLPGYNCTNFVQAIQPPVGYDTYITPLVATCLDPLDIRVTPSSLGAITNVGDIDVMELLVINNGSSDPLEIFSYELLAGAPPTLTLSGPSAPFTIPVGGTETIQVIFTPTGAAITNATLRITSNDPDEGNYDTPINVFSLPDTTAPGPQRAPCFADIQKSMERYAKVQMKTWASCYLDELSGRACDTGDRDLRIGRAAEKLASKIGGSKDKNCAGNGLSATTLGYPATCGQGCEHIAVTGMSNIPTCLECMQDRVMEGLLRDGAGTAPPDLPPNLISDSAALKCQSKILKAMQKGILKMYRELGDCENEAVLVDGAEGECLASLTAEMDKLQAKVDEAVDKCKSTAELLGCRFEGMSPDPACLGLTSENLADLLTDSTYGIEEEE